MAADPVSVQHRFFIAREDWRDDAKHPSTELQDPSIGLGNSYSATIGTRGIMPIGISEFRMLPLSPTSENVPRR